MEQLKLVKSDLTKQPTKGFAILYCWISNVNFSCFKCIVLQQGDLVSKKIVHQRIDFNRVLQTMPRKKVVEHRFQNFRRNEKKLESIFPEFRSFEVDPNFFRKKCNNKYFWLTSTWPGQKEFGNKEEQEIIYKFKHRIRRR